MIAVKWLKGHRPYGNTKLGYGYLVEVGADKMEPLAQYEANPVKEDGSKPTWNWHCNVVRKGIDCEPAEGNNVVSATMARIEIEHALNILKDKDGYVFAMDPFESVVDELADV